MVLVPTPGKGESKWKKMREIVLLTSYMKGHLRRSSALRQEDAKRRRNAQYMEVLRQGVRNLALLDGSDALLRVRAKKMGGSVAKLVNAGQVIMEVADETLLGDLELWQQGDVSLYEDEALGRRVRLRTHKRVREQLHDFWTIAQLSYGGGDEFASTIGFEGYAEMLKRIYRVVLRTYDEADASREIASDWARDAKGGDRMTRRAFCDALFELADVRESRLDTLD